MSDRAVGALPRQPALIALYVGLAAMLTMVHAVEVNLDSDLTLKRATRHAELIRGGGESPSAYRILIPHLVEPLRFALAKRGVDFQLAHEVPYLLFRGLFTFAGLLLFHAFLSFWLEPPWVLAGVFLFAALHPASYYHYWYQPASALDLVLWLAAILCGLGARSGWLLAPLMLIGALNRETVVFAPLLFAATRYGKDRPAKLVVELTSLWAIWACVFVALRWSIDARPFADPSTSLIVENLSHPGYWLYASAFFGAMWVLPLRGFSRRPIELRLLALALLPYLAIVLVRGRWREVRLLLPLAIVLIPLTLMVLREKLEGENVERAERDERPPDAGDAPA